MEHNRLPENVTPPGLDDQAVKPHAIAGVHSNVFLLCGKNNPDFRYPDLLYRDY